MSNLLPNGWTSSQLSELGSVKTSSVDKKSVDGELPVKLLNYMDVYRNNFITSKINLQNVTAKPNQVEASSLRVGDVLFTPSSETPDDIGHSAVVMEDIDKMVYSYHLMRFRDESGKLDNSFKGYAFKTNEIYKQFYKQATGSTRFTLSVGEVEKTVVIYPEDKKEQKKIAEVLSSVDEVIELTEKEISKLQDLKKGMMQELLTKGIGHTKFKDSPVGKIPEKWDYLSLDEVTTKIQDGNYGASYPKSDEFTQSGVPFLTSAAIGGGNHIIRKKVKYIPSKKHEELKKAHIKNGDVLFTNRGANVGSVAYVEDWLDGGNIGPQLTLLRAKKEISSRYLFLLMSSDFLSEQINKLDSGSAMNFFGIGTTKTFMFPFPKFEEQELIYEKINPVSDIIRFKSKCLYRLTNLKKGLMQDLLTGKVRVKV